MENRNKLVILFSLVLMVLVMLVAAWITFTDRGSNQPKISFTEVWDADAPDVSSMKMSNLTSEGKSDLFAQSGRGILVFNAAGEKVIEKNYPGTLSAAMGEVDGDGIAELLAYYSRGQEATVEAFKAGSENQPLWQVDLPGLGNVSRAAVVDFSGQGKSGMVVGTVQGDLAAVSEDGRELWRYALGSGSPLRGLDNIYAGDQELVAVADEAGNVVALDTTGKEAWTFKVTGGLRRLRTEELLQPGMSAVLLGGENGILSVLDGLSGKLLWQADLGQAISEIRLAELDADPGTRELVVGGRRSGVWGYTQDGRRLFAARVAGEKSKINEIAGMDVNGDGRDLLAVGDDTGVVTFFSPAGAKLAARNYLAPINRLTSGIIAPDKTGGARLFLIADKTKIHGWKVEESTSFKYWALIGGLLACLVIAGAAIAIISIKPAPTVQLSADQMTVEALKARRIMLHESLNDLKKMNENGQVPAEAYLERLKDLRGQLAEVDEKMLSLGLPIKAETILCPNCGGRLELGTDRCEYCGQTIIL
jgi:outer membrane protein assembly factor BamB